MEAAIWDCDPDAYRFSAAALQAILASYPGLKEQRARGTVHTEGLDVLEIGCGTGILSFRLAPYVRSITAVDTASDMIDTLRMKLYEGKGKGSNITPLCMLLEDAEDPALPVGIDGRCMKFDLVVGHLVLHHVADHAKLLDTMFSCLKPGGQVALTDFEDFGPEARRFHAEGKMSDVEHEYGIDSKHFACVMRAAGFENVSVAQAWVMDKEVERYPWEWGPKGLTKPSINETSREKIDFPFLLCKGTKKCERRQKLQVSFQGVDGKTLVFRGRLQSFRSRLADIFGKSRI